VEVMDDEATDSDEDTDSDGEPFDGTEPTSRRHPDLPDEVFEQAKLSEVFQQQVAVSFDSGANISKIEM
jgi:hypothetical protein